MVPFFDWRQAAWAGGIVLVASGSLPAAETLDPKLGRLAYATLQADDELAELNLGVKALQGGMIVLWGPSPSEALTKKAESLLKKLPGVVAVKIECDRDAVIDPLVRRVEENIKSNAPAPLTPPTLSDVKPPLPSPPPLPVVTARQVTTVEKPRHDGASKPPATTLLEPTTVNASDTDAMERVRRSDRRYAQLTIEERDGRIVISGRASDPADAWALAKKIAPLAGDKNVIVGRLR